IAGAAEQAGLSNYRVDYYNPAQLASLASLLGANGSVSGETAPYTDRGVDSIHFLMIYGTPDGLDANTTAAREVTADA
ncbi:hypothetical protein ACFR9S_13255, partial [Halolamina salina]